MANAWKNPVNRVLNLALYLVLCLMIGTGGIMWLRLPPGSGGGHGRGRGGGEAAREVLGLTRHEWGDWHLYLGLAFLAICVAHIALNWTWMMKIAASRRPWRVWVGLGAGAAIVAALMLAP
ncbi:MAG: hypothetical protein CMJ31_04925 [Phycisphaerae bacterium]|nr:hypothetical protein [Phycisphaerae bacterium]